MRIIAGSLRSRSIKTLKGDNTRPTSDRVKEAIFNRFGPYFEGGSILDVFSGSGAMSFEALSRGMHHATLIEKNKNAQRIILENAKNFELMNHIELIKKDAKAVLGTLEETYDIIFMDPPYDYKETEALLKLLYRLLKRDGIILIETDKFTDLPNEISNLIKTNEKQYGFSKIHTYEMSS